MSYEAPTSAEFKSRFPEFADVSDTVVYAAILESESYVGTNWIERDYKIGRLFAAAHFIAMEGGVKRKGAPGPAKSVRVGDLSVTYGGSSTGDKSDFSQTSYGARYRTLLRKNVGGVRVVGL